jgi:hypothetical protein
MMRERSVLASFWIWLRTPMAKRRLNSSRCWSRLSS